MKTRSGGASCPWLERLKAPGFMSFDSEKDGGAINYLNLVSGLELAPLQLGRYPNIQDFIDNHSKDLKARGLKIAYKNGAAPKLKLKAAGQDTAETVPIDNWKSKHIADYLKARRKKAEVAARGCVGCVCRTGCVGVEQKGH